VNTLPVTFEKDNETMGWKGHFDDDESLFEDGPMYTALRHMDHTEVMYVGVPSSFIPVSDQPMVEAMLAEINCFPVYCAPNRAHNHFQGYCKGVLWPTFHNVVDLYSKSNQFDDDKEEESEGWKKPRSWSPMEAEKCWPDHCAINRLFALKVVEVFSPGDIIWIHDYHLMLLPNYLTRKLGSLKPSIGLFLHIPFPSSEIFRILATREEILRAMLCANHIGFNMYEYARHFLTCCSRMLGLSFEPKKGGIISINNNGTSVAVTCSHVGLNTHFVLESLHKSLTLHFVKQWKQREDVQRIVAIDEVEGLRGLSLKLHAFDRLLTDYPYLRHKVSLLQIGLILSCRPDDYQQCHDEVVGLVEKLNQKWGPCVEYIERKSIGLCERLALFSEAQVFVESSVRLGVNMLPFEFLLASQEKHGVLVLSEFSATSRVFSGAMKVNPYKTNALAAAMEEALSMPDAERIARGSRDRQFVKSNTLLAWTNRVLQDIEASKALDAGTTTIGLGFGPRVGTSGMESSHQELVDPTTICEAYRRSSKRLIVLDYSGTLVETSSLDTYMKTGGNARSWHYENGGSERPSGCLETRDSMSDAARSSVVDLCKDPNNTVVIVSSDLRDELDNAVKGIPNLALIAENGFVFRMSPSDKWRSAIDEEGGGGDWYAGGYQDLYHLQDNDSQGGYSSEANSVIDADIQTISLDQWHVSVLSVMRQYSDRTNGAFVWRSPSAVSFNYILADPDLGKLQAATLTTELETVLALLPLTVDAGKGYVTVRLRGVNRGTAIRELIGYQTGLTKQRFDFVAGFGDDTEDEGLFTAVNKYKASSNDIAKYSIRVSSNPRSRAKYFVNDTDEVLAVLKDMSESGSTSKIRKNFSKGDFKRGDDRLGGVLITKQSLVSLNQLAEVPVAESPKAIHQSASYVASASDADELWGGAYASTTAASDPRPIPADVRSDSDSSEDDESIDDVLERFGGDNPMPRKSSMYPEKSTTLNHHESHSADEDDSSKLLVAALGGAAAAVFAMKLFRI